MISLDVELGARSYTISIGRGLLDSGAWWAGHVQGRTVALVTNDTVAALYAHRLQQTLEEAGARVVPIVLPDGEVFKTANTLNMVYDALLAAHCDRQTLLVALGGGVVGDIAGFAAATYQRGIAFIQVPTTLLAQVDSSVGGKTGINHPSGKNMIGAFHQPRAVLIDVDTLRTLSDREFGAGLAEIIKHGAACDAGYFGELELTMDRLLLRNPDVLSEVIAGSCRIKSRIVASDEREAGLRAILNFGHTFGHAIETGMGYGSWLHGEAVAAGMVQAARLSVDLGTLSAGDAQRIVALLEQARLPIASPSFGTARWLELMERDKKASEGAPRFVLLRGIGQAYLAKVDPDRLHALLGHAPMESAVSGPASAAVGTGP